MPLRELLFGASIATVFPLFFGGDYSGNFFSHRRDGAGDTLTLSRTYSVKHKLGRVIN